MILYTEETFDQAFKDYNKQRVRSNLPMQTRETYRPIFEQELIDELFE